MQRFLAVGLRNRFPLTRCFLRMCLCVGGIEHRGRKNVSRETFVCGRCICGSTGAPDADIGAGVGAGIDAGMDASVDAGVDAGMSAKNTSAVLEVRKT